MTVSPARVVLVTLGLSLLGAACGAVFGGLTLLAHSPPMPHLPPMPMRMLWRAVAHFLLFSFKIGALAGSVIGAFVTPIVSWLFVRRVPLDRAIRETAIGVGLGLTAGWLFPLDIAFLLGLTGFVLAGGRLWWVSRPQLRHPEAAI